MLPCNRNMAVTASGNGFICCGGPVNEPGTSLCFTYTKKNVGLLVINCMDLFIFSTVNKKNQAGIIFFQNIFLKFFNGP